MERDSKEYRERKLAYEMATSKAWNQYLKPLLEDRSSIKLLSTPIDGLDSCISLAKSQGRAEAYKTILDKINRLANEYSNIIVTSNGD